MNRRLMMAQQNKVFELVYDAASGVLPTERGWNFAFGTYGGALGVHGGLQEFTDGSLNVIVGHVNESCHYYPIGKTVAKNCEFSITVDNINSNDGSTAMRMGFLLTDGEKAMGVVFYPLNSGRLMLTNNANSLYSGYRWREKLGNQTNFTLRARLENGVVSVWFNDTLLPICNNLYTISDMSLNSPNFLFNGAKNQIAFACYGSYQVSNMTYKEW